MPHAVIEHRFDCPYCGESITMLLDPAPGGQAYVEDCEVCCNPVSIDFEVVGDVVTEFRAERVE